MEIGNKFTLLKSFVELNNHSLKMIKYVDNCKHQVSYYTFLIGDQKLCESKRLKMLIVK